MGGLKFPFYQQPDQMDCDPTCLQMISKHYGRSLSLEKLRRLSETTRQGTSLKNIADTAEKIGFRTLGAKIDFEKLREDAPLPCIVFWQQHHFAVVYKIKGERLFVADPAHGLLEYSKSTHLELMTLEIDSDNLCFDYLSIISEFECMGGVKIEIRFKNSSPKNIKILEDVLVQYKYSGIKFFSCHVVEDSKFIPDMIKLLDYYVKFRVLYVKGRKSSKPKKELYCNNRNALFLYNEIDDVNKYFRTRYIINRDFFTESLKHNVFLNKKLSISSKGEIKNSFDYKTIHGFIQDKKTLNNVLKIRNLTSLWYANNDKIIDLKHLPTRYCIINPYEIKYRNQNEYEIV